jgi:hypothetical protein
MFGDYNTDVTVNGIGLTGVSQIQFNGVAGVIQPGGTATQLHVHAPSAGVITGHVKVFKGLAAVQAPQDFTLLALSNVAPLSALPGQHVVLSGHGFTGATHVRFDGADASFVVDNDGQITATVPAGAPTGTVSVSTTAGIVTSASSFAVLTVRINEFSTGTTGASDDEFVELENVSSSAADLQGCELLYRAATATDSSTDVVIGDFVAPHNTIPAGGFYVLGGDSYAGPPAAETTFAHAVDLDATGGGLALICGQTLNDSVGWGTATNAFVEGTAAAAPAADSSAARTPDGTDTNDNSSDFAPDATPTPGATNG